MRLGDVVQHAGDGTVVSPSARYQCRGCDKWVLLRDAENTGGCSTGCCDDYRCPHCQHVTRVEWPD